MRITPEIPSVAAEAKRLKEDGVDILIALGHSGFEIDVEIAKHVEDVDLVVGGHSNTFLYTGEFRFPYPDALVCTYRNTYLRRVCRRDSAGRRNTDGIVPVLGGTADDRPKSARGPGVSHHQILGPTVAGVRRGRRSGEQLRQSDSVGFRYRTRCATAFCFRNFYGSIFG